MTITLQQRTLDLLLLCYVVWVIGFSINMLPWQIDDAYIAYRYVENYLKFHVFSFNQTGISVEGVTSTLWFWVLVILSYITKTNHLELLGPLVNVIILLLDVFFLRKILLAKMQNVTVFGILILFLSIPAVQFYAVNGMDEILFSSLILFIGLHIAGYCQNKIVCHALIVLAVLARPESPVILIMLVIKCFFQLDMKNTREQFLYLITLVMAMTLLVIYRYTIFDEFLPNTFYAKPSDIYDGIDYLFYALKNEWWFSVLIAVALLGAVFGDQKNKIIFLFGVVWLLVPIIEGGDWMPLLRFFLPSIFLFSISIAGLIESRVVLNKYVAVTVIFLMVCKGYSIINDMHKGADIDYSAKTRMYLLMQNWLDVNNLHIIASLDIGRIFYKKDYQIIDLAGLTDKTIARLPGKHLDKKVDVSYLLNSKVQVVMLRFSIDDLSGNVIRSDMFESNTEFYLFYNQDFQKNYKFLMFLRFPIEQRAYESDGYMIFVRKDLKINHAPLPVVFLNGFPFVDL